MNNLIFIILVFLPSFTITTAQEAVISEYYNVSGIHGADEEWVEIFITEDGISLSGWYLMDNSAAGTWQGGVMFKYITLWQQLFEGTVIVIHFRQQSQEIVTKKEGYIEVHAENSMLFEKVNGQFNPPNWQIGTFQIGQEKDIIALFDNTKSPVHSIAHNAGSLDSFNSLTCPKLNYNTSIIDHTSLQVVPGGNITDYSGNGADKLYYSTNHTKGYPNSSPAFPLENSSYWRSAREPGIVSMGLDIYAQQDKIFIKKNHPTARGLHFIVIRYESVWADPRNKPVDGNNYNIGDSIGTSIVIANFDSQDQIELEDNLSVLPNTHYTYRIFAYRYPSSADHSEDSGLGPAYNTENYEEDSHNTDNDLPKPDIEVLEGRTVFCEMEIVHLAADIDPETLGDNIVFQWQINGSDHSRHDTLITDIPGTYTLTLIDTTTDNRSPVSNSITLTVIDSPDAILYGEDDEIIYSDTTIYKCPDEKYNMRVEPVEEATIQWFLNGMAFAPSWSLNTELEGEYFAVVSIQDECHDTTATITIKDRSADFIYAPSELYFNTISNPVGILTIINQSEEPLVLYESDFNLPAFFEFKDLDFPIILQSDPGNNSINIEILFTLSQPGQIKDTLRINNRCGGEEKVSLIGLNPGITDIQLFASADSIDFGLKLSCMNDRYTTLRLTAAGAPVRIDTIYSLQPFRFELPKDSAYPMELMASGAINLAVYFNGSLDGIYTDSLIVIYEMAGKIDTLNVYLSGEITTPDFSLIEPVVEFDKIAECETPYIDTLIAVKNTGKVNLIFNEQPSNSALIFTDLSIEIKPDSVGYIPARYYPQSTDDDLTFSFQANPCLVAKNITLKGGKDEVDISIADNTLDFGTIVDCDNERYLDSVLVTVSGKPVRITEHSLNPPFELLNPDDELLPGDNYLKIRFSNFSEGNYREDLKLTFSPCGENKVITIMGERITPAFTVSADDVYFGTQGPGETKTMKVTITNTGSVDISLEDILYLVHPFEQVKPKPSELPLTITPGEPFEIELAYTPTVYNTKDSIDIEFSLGPCEDTEIVTLRGNTIPGPDTAFISLTPGQGTAVAGNIIEVPLSFDNNENFISLGDLEINRIYAELYFDYTVLDLREIVDSPNYDAAIEKTDYGANIEVDFRQFPISDGNWITLKFLGLWGTKTETELYADSIYVEANHNAFVESDTSIIDIEGICLPEKRMVAVDEGLELDINSGSVINTNSEIRGYLPVDENSSLKMYDQAGRDIMTFFEGRSDSGSFNVMMPWDKLSPGTYTLILRNGFMIKTKRLIIIK
ncbi:MAG: hypothetical protein ACLFR2_06530 [Candidatus Kapaibacterium sp.]